MDLASGIVAATEGLKFLSELRKIDKELDKTELKLRLVEVADKLLESKEALMTAQGREHDFLLRISELEQMIADNGKLEDEDGLLFKLDEKNQRIGQPFCNHCFVKEGKFYRLVYGPYMMGSHLCNNCNQAFGKFEGEKNWF